MTFLPNIDASPSLVTMWVCVLVGALILTQFTRITGVIGFLLNGAALFAGAKAANFLAAGVDVPVTFVTQKTLLVTLCGMLISSFLMLLVFSRPSRG